MDLKNKSETLPIVTKIDVRRKAVTNINSWHLLRYLFSANIYLAKLKLAENSKGTSHLFLTITL